MGPIGTEVICGFAIVLVCPLINWFQYQLFSLSHKMVGIYPTTREKNDYSKLNGLIIFDAHSSTSDGKRFPFGLKFIVAKLIGYALYVLPIFGPFMLLEATSSDATKSFIAPLRMNTTALALVFFAILVSLIVLSLLEQIEHPGTPGKWHTPAKLIITIVVSLSIMVVPGLCSNISNLKLICLMNSNQEVCADVRSEITCNSHSYNNKGFHYTTEGNEVVKNYFLNTTGTHYFNHLVLIVKVTCVNYV